MKISRDLYYILNFQEEFVNAPWSREHSTKKALERFFPAETLSFDLLESNVWRAAPLYHRESAICFGSPAGSQALPETWSIKFQPYAYHTGDRQPLQIKEARKMYRKGEDLAYMPIPIRSASITFVENIHTLTDCDF